jgi:ligand-binding SRPBCC domain-containing protein
MPRIEVVTIVRAPIAVVFDLARSIDAHRESQSGHREHAVAGCTSGLIELGESVTWEAVHFGIRQRLTSRIVAMNRPLHFRDSMVEGAFDRFDHDHYFSAMAEGGTTIKDVFDYTSPLGPLGKLADALLLRRYMCRMLSERNEILRHLAESGEYERFITTA